jgi:hypothetical protein
MFSLLRILGVALIAAAFIAQPAHADVGASERLAREFRAQLDRNELPPLNPFGMGGTLFVGQQQLQINAAQLQSLHQTQRQMITRHAIEGLRFDSIDCGPELCWVRYSYRFTSVAGAAQSSGNVAGQALYVRDGERFLLTVLVQRQ